MSPTAALTLDFRNFFVLAPEITLAAWGMLVLMVDVGWLRKRPSAERQQTTARLAMVGTVLALAVALVPFIVRFNVYGLQETLNFVRIDPQIHPDPVLFFGTIAGDLLTETLNVVFILMLALVVRMSTAWTFTDNWGEYFGLLFWSTVGMMLLAAADELLTLFLTLEMMTICLYLCTAIEKDRRRSAEGGLKYFVYGSVSSALFLFGLSLLYGLTGTTTFYAIHLALTPQIGSHAIGLGGNVVGATALLLMLVGFGFKVAAVPFHQWAPDAYEGAPAPVTAWVATGSKVASFVALMKVLLFALGPWSSQAGNASTPGWIGVVAALSAASMTFGNLAALAQRNLKRMLAYSSIAHAGYMLVGVVAAGVSVRHAESAGSVLYYLVVYGFSNLGAFAVAAWLARDKKTDNISDLNGLGFQNPALATCILLLMLSLIGMPPLAGFFGKLYMFMEALNEGKDVPGRLTLLWLVALGLLNSVISAFYYVRVLKAMFLRHPEGGALGQPSSAISLPIVIGTFVVVVFGLFPAPLIEGMKAAAVPMLEVSALVSPDKGIERAVKDQSVYNPTPVPAALPIAAPATAPSLAVDVPKGGPGAPPKMMMPGMGPGTMPGAPKGARKGARKGAAAKKGGPAEKGAPAPEVPPKKADAPPDTTKKTDEAKPASAPKS
ncbi:MAG: NADH-quinone oxidoreductase subunit NuoN [Isosphaeraceae bacterium]|nr:NADH-quinone oxidoreductase subunit NuoN [Isosphaeraceae bacterium]